MNDEIEIVFSSVIHQDHQDVGDEINELNKRFENLLCKGKGMHFVDNSNIKSSSLNRSKLHLNKGGTALLTKNCAKIVHLIDYMETLMALGRLIILQKAFRLCLQLVSFR